MQNFELSEFKKLYLNGYTVVDARKQELFCEGFIEGSVSVPFAGNFTNALEELISPEIKVLIVADENDIAGITKAVKGSGMNNIAGCLAGGYGAWLSAGNKFDMLVCIDADEFAIDFQFDEFFLVDVRAKEDYDKGHVEYAENIALVDLESLLSEMEAKDICYLYGETPAEAITAGSLLKRNGFQRVRPVAADYEAIKATGIELFAPSKKGNSNPGPAKNQ